MKARFAQVCAAITVAVFAVVTVFFVLRLSEAHEHSVLNGETHFAALSKLVAGAYEAADHSFEKIDWERLVDAFDLTRTAGAVLVASGQGQLEYVTARDIAYLSPATRLQLKENQKPPTGQGVHYLLTRSPHELRLSETLSTEGGEFVHVEAVYPTLTNADIYPVLRDSFLILLGFASLTLVSALGLYLHRKAPLETPQPVHHSEPAASSDAPDDYSAEFANDFGNARDNGLDNSIDGSLDYHLESSQDKTNASDREKAKLLRRLSSELERSTFNEEDLVLALLRVSSTDAKKRTDSDSDGATDHLSDESRMLDRLYSFIALEHAFKELTFTLGDNIIAIIEPNNDIDGGMRRMENLLRKADERAITEGGKLHGGLSARAGRLTESPRLFKEAYTALRRAEYQKARLMAFRPDPNLYRRFVAGEEAAVEST